VSRLDRIRTHLMMMLGVLMRNSRTIIVTSHPSILVFLFCVHWSYVLGVSEALVFDRNQISYGQVLSLFSPLPGLWSFWKILINYQVDIKVFIKRSPSFVAEGVCFIATGRHTWSTIQETLDRDYFHWSRRRWFISEYRNRSQQTFSLSHHILTPLFR
jgi:hypothetical protein